MRPIARPGLALIFGLAVVIFTALLPAGLDGSGIPGFSWVAWWIALTASVATLSMKSGGFARSIRTLAWLLPPVAVLSLPAAAFAARGEGSRVAAALVLRAMAAAAAGLATFALLGPSGLIAGLRSLRVPPRLVEIVHAMLVSLTGMVRQVSGMLRARAARRISFAPWSALAVGPIETLRDFGRLVGALLLRSMERAESTERARRARGGLDG